MSTKKTTQTTKQSTKPLQKREGISENILQLIGNTPILKLTKLTQDKKINVLAKLEFLNPGGSIKDRIGIQMLEVAEAQGLIKTGYTIVEPTSGNTGLGLAMAAIAKGYKMIFTLPDKMSKEKIDLLRAFGAKVIITPTNVAPDHPANYVKVAERIVKETPNSFMPNQYFNKANPQTHYQTTGPEIWQQTSGKIDVLVATIGTGGTISGIAKYLKEQNPNIRIVGVDPEGSLYHHEFYGTKDKADIHSYKVEGIGEDFIPSTLNLKIVDEIITVSDKDAFLTARELAQKEGVFAGGSSGAAVFAALQVSKKLGGEKTVVVILPDTGRNYLNKFYSDEWMIENGFIEGKEAKISVSQLLSSKASKINQIVSIYPEAEIGLAISLMKKYGISQLPVISDGIQVGSIREIAVMKKLAGKVMGSNQKVSEFLEPPLPTIDIDDKIATPLNLLKAQNALVVTKNGEIVDIITTIDVINYLLNGGM
jgi:cystathionine beta-synthase